MNKEKLLSVSEIIKHIINTYIKKQQQDLVKRDNTKIYLEKEKMEQIYKLVLNL